MPQLVKKRRSGWAILAAGALVASLLAVGATPVAAVERNIDDPATWKACLGEAASTDHGFTDVSASGTHGTNINCLAYYNITTGKTDDTYAPRDNVTRSQMALFLARAADVADIDLDPTMDDEAGFTDIAGLSAEKRNAINRLVAADIMFGDTVDSYDPPSSTRFAPYDNVARWEMAMFLFAFLDLALDSVIIDEIPERIDGDGVGHIELQDTDGDGRGVKVDDYFRDARRETPAHVDDAIGALYELGVTTGTNGQVGELGIFDPNGLVTRDQMASFIMRALGHTNLRPAGITAQSTTARTQVSVRTADFRPIEGESVEVITSDYPDLAFDDRDGECVTDPPYVADITPSIDTCRIDTFDDETDGDGNQEFDVGLGGGGAAIQIACSGSVPLGTFSLMAASNPDAHVWAWTGAVGDTVDDETDLALAEPANTVDELFAPVTAVITGGSMNHIRMGNTVTYVVQLKDKNGNAAGPLPGEDYRFEVTVVATLQDNVNGVADNDDIDVEEVGGPNAQRDGETNEFTQVRIRDPKDYYPDDSGRFSVTTSYTNPSQFDNDPDVKIHVEVRRSAANEMTISDMTMGTAIEDTASGVIGTITPAVRFSDNSPYANALVAETSVWLLLNPNGTNRNTVRLSVTNQYGDLLRDRNAREDLVTDDYYVDADSDVTGVFSQSSITDAAYFPLSNTGRETLGYSRDSRDNPPTPVEETLTVRGSEVALALGLPLGDPIPGTDPPRNVAATDEGATADAKVLWADRATFTTRTTRPTYGTSSGTALPVVLLVGGDNYILVHQPTSTDVGDSSNGYAIISVMSADGTALRPMAYRYGSDDAFFVEGSAVTYDQFQQIVGSMLVSIDRETEVDGVITTLTWDRFDHGMPQDRAVWRLAGIECADPSTGGGGAD